MQRKGAKPRDVRLLAIMELADRNPDTWLSMGTDPETIAAIAVLERRGVVDIHRVRREFKLRMLQLP